MFSDPQGPRSLRGLTLLLILLGGLGLTVAPVTAGDELTAAAIRQWRNEWTAEERAYLGLFLRPEKEVPAALEEYAQAHPDTYLGAWAQMDAGEYAAARAAFQGVIDRYAGKCLPDRDGSTPAEKADMQIGACYLEEGKKPSAIAYWQSFIQLRPFRHFGADGGAAGAAAVGGAAGAAGGDAVPAGLLPDRGGLAGRRGEIGGCGRRAGVDG
jgi:tetratricopeptide (TPR) repeat protein